MIITESLPSRKKNRLGKRLYNSWWFFVTICTQEKICYFGDKDVGADTIRLNIYGKIVEKNLWNISSIYTNISLGDYVIMPNHIHIILFIDNEVNEAIDNRPYGSLSQIIKWLKQITTKQLHEAWLPSFKRQKSFYDHVVRNEADLKRIQEYIELNPYNRDAIKI